MPSPTPMQFNLMLRPFGQGLTINPSQILLQLLLSLWWLWGFLIILAIIWVWIKIYKVRRLHESGIYQIDLMSGDDFEKRLQILFTNLGYKSTRTSSNAGIPDYGVDLVIEKDGVKTAVQAKRWRGYVGEDAVRQAYTAMNLYKCSQAMVVTNSNFSQMAWHLAKSTNVTLWNRKRLIKALLMERDKPVV